MNEEAVYLPIRHVLVWSLAECLRDVSKPVPAPRKPPLTDKQAHENYLKRVGGL